jgi:hypothetical protein
LQKEKNQSKYKQVTQTEQNLKNEPVAMAHMLDFEGSMRA